MKRNTVKWAGAFIALFFIAGSLVHWFLFENSNSYKCPTQALLSADEDVILIQAYKMNDKSLFFFIKNQDQLGASYIHKGLFGWQLEHLAWSPFDTNITDNHLNGYQGYGDNLIYGLMTNGDDQIVTLNNDVAQILNLEMLPAQVVEQYHLNGLYLWYIENDHLAEKEGEIKLVDKYSDEVLDVVLK